MPEFGFVVCSQDPELAKNTTNWIQEHFPVDTKIFIYEEQTSIFECYNKGIDKTKDCRYVCFVHEDIDIERIDIPALRDRLEFFNTGFVGVAGAVELDEEGVWWAGYDGNPHPNLSGQAGHQKDEHGFLRRWYNNYGEIGKVQVLDGVILFCKRELLDKVRWDAETFTDFDFYDISITYLADKLGYDNVTFNKLELYHWGLGNPRGNWDKNRRIFLSWKDNPLNA